MNTGESKFEELSILVTGENGFIANNFVRLSGFKNCRKISLRNHSLLPSDFTGVDVIFHLAALVHDKSTDEFSFLKINRDLTLKLAEAAKSAGVKHFIFMSSSKVYGEESFEEVYNEDSECNPSDFYGKSKLEAELLLKKLADESFCVSIVRTPVVFGKGMKANMLKLKNLVKYFPVLPFGGIFNQRCYTYIENLTAYIDRIIILRIPGIFIIMDPEPLSTTDLVKLLGKAMNRKVILFTLPGPVKSFLSHVSKSKYERLYNSFILDNSKTRSLLSFEPPFSTEDGIRRMINEA